MKGQGGEPVSCIKLKPIHMHPYPRHQGLGCVQGNSRVRERLPQGRKEAGEWGSGVRRKKEMKCSGQPWGGGSPNITETTPCPPQQGGLQGQGW